jgi:hypothetical protein
MSSSGFRRLWLSYTTNEFGNWLGEVALAVLVFDRTGSPLAATALFLSMQFVPALIAPAVVARVEPLRMARLLPALYAAEGLAFVALAVLATHFVLIAVIALVATSGTLAIAAKTFTRTAVVALLGPSDEVRQGNALINFGFTAAGAAGQRSRGSSWPAWECPPRCCSTLHRSCSSPRCSRRRVRFPSSRASRRPGSSG